MIPSILAPEGRSIPALPTLGADLRAEVRRIVTPPDPATLDPDHVTVLLIDEATAARTPRAVLERFAECGALLGIGDPGEATPGHTLGSLPLVGWIPDDAAPPLGRTALAGALRHATTLVAMRRVARSAHDAARDLLELSAVGDALITERDLPTLLETIVTQALRLTEADAASLYLVRTDEVGAPATLEFVSTRNQTRPTIPFARIEVPIDHHSLAGHVALTGMAVNLPDAYQLPGDAPYRFNRTFDEQFAYRTISMLVVPMRTHRDETIGVLQLINRKRDPEARLVDADAVSAQVLPFDARAERIGAALAAHAAVAVENARLYEAIEGLLEGFVRAAVTAIESRDPTTSGHSFRVAALSTELATVVDGVREGPYAGTRFSKTQLRELRYAGLLHDFGKVGVRESVLVKQKKLYGHDLVLLRQRIDLLRVQADLAFERQRAELLTRPEAAARTTTLGAWEAARHARLAELARWMEIIERANEPSVLPADVGAELEAIAHATYLAPDGTTQPVLTERELQMLRLPKGNLDPHERREIESHVTHTYEFLRSIPWTRELRDIPTIAWGHHEKLDGSGYPRGVTGADLPVQTRMMTIADIYDALTATDRPYKRALPAERALDILAAEAGQGLIDRALLDLFVGAQVFTRVAPTDGASELVPRPSRPVAFG